MKDQILTFFSNILHKPSISVYLLIIVSSLYLIGLQINSIELQVISKLTIIFSIILFYASILVIANEQESWLGQRD